MKLNSRRNRLSLMGASAALALGLLGGVVAVHAADKPASPTVKSAPEAPGNAGAAGTLEVAGAPDSDGPGGHADAPGANVDNQHDAVGDSDG